MTKTTIIEVIYMNENIKIEARLVYMALEVNEIFSADMGNENFSIYFLSGDVNGEYTSSNEFPDEYIFYSNLCILDETYYDAVFIGKVKFSHNKGEIKVEKKSTRYNKKGYNVKIKTDKKKIDVILEIK